MSVTQLRRVSALLSISLVVLIAVLYVTSQIIVGRSFVALEKQNTRQNVQRALEALSNEFAELNSKAGDWANWDDAYAFIQDRNEDFIRINVPDNAFVQLRINVILFVQPSGVIVFGKAVDLESEAAVSIPAALLACFTDPPARDRLLQNRNPKGSLTGILRLPEGPLLIAARPVLTSEMKGPIRGTLIFGRYLDADEIAKLGEITHLTLSLFPFDVPRKLFLFRSASPAQFEPSSISVQPLNRKSVAGFFVLKDIFDAPTLVLRVDLPRTIHQEGQATLRYFLVWVIGIALVFGFAARQTLIKLILSRREYRESEKRYRAVIEQAAEGIFLLDSETNRMIEANAAFRKLLGYAPEEIPGRIVFDFVADDPTGGEPNLRSVPTEIVDFVGERIYRRRDGSLFAAEVSASLISYGGRKVTLGVVRDMTERKQAEAERARLYEQEQTRREELTALYALSRTLADTSDFEAVLDLVVRQAVETIHITFARILLIENADLVLRAGCPVPRLDRDLQVGRREPIGKYPFCRRLLAQNRPAVVRAEATEMSDDERALLFPFVSRSLCLIPLSAAERVFGLLVLGEERSEERERFTPEKIHLASSIGDQAASALRRAELFAELERAYFQTVLSLARAIDAKDSYTADHAERLGEMTLAVGRILGMAPRELEDLRYGAILHDIGKIGVSDAILQKPAKLDPTEWIQMRRHSEVGAQILAPIRRLEGAAKIVRHHHERYDGAGYPDGLVGEAIPLGARVLTVVDSYCAIIDKRVYKEARPLGEAAAELKRCAGTQFDPSIVDVFLESLDRGAAASGNIRPK